MIFAIRWVLYVVCYSRSFSLMKNKFYFYWKWDYFHCIFHGIFGLSTDQLIMIMVQVFQVFKLLMARACGHWSYVALQGRLRVISWHILHSLQTLFQLVLKIAGVESDASRSHKLKWCGRFGEIVSELGSLKQLGATWATQTTSQHIIMADAKTQKLMEDLGLKKKDIDGLCDYHNKQHFCS